MLVFAKSIVARVEAQDASFTPELTSVVGHATVGNGATL